MFVTAQTNYIIFHKMLTTIHFTNLAYHESIHEEWSNEYSQYKPLCFHLGMLRNRYYITSFLIYLIRYLTWE